jgi:small subunit ribosomal protein S14
MAKKSMVAREVKRKKLARRYAARRETLKKQIVDQRLDDDVRWHAMMELQQLPRDGSRTRQRNRCALTGRPRGYYRRGDHAGRGARRGQGELVAPGGRAAARNQVKEPRT